MSANYLADMLSISIKRPEPEHARSEGLEYAVAIIGKHVEKKAIYVPALDEFAAAAEALFTPVLQKRGHDPSTPLELVGYDVAATNAGELKEKFLSSRRAAQVIRNRLSFNLIVGFAMPRAAQAFSAAVVGGYIKMPKPERKKPSFRHRDILLSAIAKRVSRAYPVHLGAAKTKYSEQPSPPICGVTVAAAALRGFGIPIEWERADVVVRKHLKDIHKLESGGALMPSRLKSTANALRAYSEPEYYADAQEYSLELGRALQELGYSDLLPRFDSLQ